LITADRGLCGGYNSAAIKAAEELGALLRSQGKEPVMYVIGRKGLGYFTFRNRPVVESWTGFSERPTYDQAREIADVLVSAFMAGVDDDDENAGDDGILGVDEIHIVFTQFKSMLSQSAVALRIAPMVIEYVGEQENDGPQTLFSFEPNAENLFDALLPRYIATRVYSALLEAAASESASRRRAMKSATDNADDLIKALTLEANRERQAQITQEISEIVGGANALADAK
jgi:F-type H+-transporting ATPase subunit gamma